MAENQSVAITPVPRVPKPTPGSERVGEGIPPLLTKKFLAVHFGCWSGGKVRRRFWSKVLTDDVLDEAEIDRGWAMSWHCKTFSAVQSARLKRILFPVAIVLLPALGLAQAAVPTEMFVRDTFQGRAVVTDSIWVMRTLGQVERVQAPVVLDAVMVKEYAFTTNPDGSPNPRAYTQRFFDFTGQRIPESRLLLFTQQPKK